MARRQWHAAERGWAETCGSAQKIWDLPQEFKGILPNIAKLAQFSSQKKIEG